MPGQILRLQAQLAGRVEERRHPLFHLRKMLGVDVHPLGVGPQLAGRLVDLDQRRIQQLGRILQRRIDLGQPAQPCLQAAQPAADGIVVPLQRIDQGVGPGQQVVSMRQPLLLGRQRFPLARCQPQLREFIDLPLQPLDPDGLFARAMTGRFQCPGRLLPLLPVLPKLGQLPFLSGHAVEQLALGARPQQMLRLVLAMNVHQLLAQLAQPRNRARVAVDLCPRTAVLLDDAPQQQGTRITGQIVFGQPGGQRVVDAELRRDVGPLGPFADQRGIAASAQHQAHRIQQDRLARAGLAGQYGEARPEFDLGRFDDHEIPESQPVQHDGGSR